MQDGRGLPVRAYRDGPPPAPPARAIDGRPRLAARQLVAELSGDRRTSRAGVVGRSVDLADIQGNVLRGYTHPTAAYLFLRIVDVPSGARADDADAAAVVTAEPWTGAPATRDERRVHLRGLSALGLPTAVLDSFPDEFREGMAARAEQLGDRGPTAPDTGRPAWEIGERARARHRLRGRRRAPATPRCDAILAVDATAAWSWSTSSAQRRSAAARDHFGFSDGIAQPAVAGAGVAPRARVTGSRTARGGWREVATGEFAARLRGRGRRRRPRRRPRRFDRNGTFVVYRKLAMDVAAFRRFIADAGTPIRAGRTCWRRRSSGAGPTARRSRSRPSGPTGPIRPTRCGSTTSATRTTPAG